MNQSHNDFISNLHILDEQTLPYFFHAFDRDKNEYQLYHHTFHPSTGELTEKWSTPTYSLSIFMPVRTYQLLLLISSEEKALYCVV